MVRSSGLGSRKDSRVKTRIIAASQIKTNGPNLEYSDGSQPSFDNEFMDYSGSDHDEHLLKRKGLLISYGAEKPDKDNLEARQHSIFAKDKKHYGLG